MPRSRRDAWTKERRPRRCDIAPNDESADGGERDGSDRQRAQDPDSRLRGLFQLRVDLLRSRVIHVGEELEILVERLADGAIGVVVAPFAARPRPDLETAPHQIAAKFLEL